MLTKIKLGLGLALAVGLIGCGAGQAGSTQDLTAAEDTDSGKEDSARKNSHPSYYKCAADADCVAVEKAGCCPNGFLVAVNKDKVKAYNTTFACQTAPQVCPLFVVNDKRVAQCDFQKHQCQMIEPSAIRCDAFIAPAYQHHCPEGFQCKFTGVPDVGGTCEATPSSPSQNL
ncbi:MAG: hypothetical protein JWN44_3456 [Myxococcales bacterium]|nr:hypothetical protein [Myxococcales bacterium]